MRVLLVHGMGRTTLSLAGLARALRRDGHRVELAGYVAALHKFELIRERVRRRLERIAAHGAPYAVVGHSLGGLILRHAIAGLEPAPKHLVMLATPNRPPRLATRLKGFLPYRIFGGESGQLLAAPAFFASLPDIRVPYTIIAGDAGPRGRRSHFGDDSNDWVVAVDETRVGAHDAHRVFPVGHTFIMNDARVRDAVRRALQ